MKMKEMQQAVEPLAARLVAASVCLADPSASGDSHDHFRCRRTVDEARVALEGISKEIDDLQRGVRELAVYMLGTLDGKGIKDPVVDKLRAMVGL